MLGDIKNTQIVGFATTIRTLEDDHIQSLQSIYYSTESSICSCLGENPTISRDSIKVEPIPEDESYLETLTRHGELNIFLDTIYSAIGLIIVTAVTICCLCYFAKK